MKKLIQYISLIFIFLFPSESIAQGLENRALTSFQKQFNDWKKSRFPGSSGLENPWKPYLNRPFYEGLSLQDQKLYLSLQDSGDCLSVIQLDLIGFSRLYPFLNPAFERKDIRTDFEGAVAHRYSQGARRCDALWSSRSAELSMNGIPTAQLYIVFIRESSRNSPEITQKRTIKKPLFGSIEINFRTHYAKWCGSRSD